MIDSGRQREIEYEYVSEVCEIERFSVLKGSHQKIAVTLFDIQ